MEFVTRGVLAVVDVAGHTATGAIGLAHAIVDGGIKHEQRLLAAPA